MEGDAKQLRLHLKLLSLLRVPPGTTHDLKAAIAEGDEMGMMTLGGRPPWHCMAGQQSRACNTLLQHLHASSTTAAQTTAQPCPTAPTNEMAEVPADEAALAAAAGAAAAVPAAVAMSMSPAAAVTLDAALRRLAPVQTLQTIGCAHVFTCVCVRVYGACMFTACACWRVCVHVLVLGCYTRCWCVGAHKPCRT